MRHLYFDSSIIKVVLLIILILPITIVLSSTTRQETMTQDLITPDFIDLGEREEETNNFLFRLNQYEQTEFSKILNEVGSSNIHYYENFPKIGFVSLTDEQVSRLELEYPDFYSRMFRSEIKQVLPEVNDLLEGSTIEQSSYLSPAEIIEASTLWNQEILGTGIEIAIIDSGVDDNHPDFNNRIKYQESFVKETYGFSYEEDYSDLHGHGTHVAGIAAGSGSSYPGIAPNATLINLKAADMTGHSTPEAFLAAVDKAITLKVDIISISLGFSISSPWSSDYDILSEAVDEAVQEGIVVVVAAGNEGDTSDYATINSPASGKEVITVGATNMSNNIAYFSSRGPSVDFRMDPDVVAPGVRIYAPLAEASVLKQAYNAISGVYLSDYISLSGTSMATPVVSGAIALLKQAFPNAWPEAFRAALQESASTFNSVSSYVQGNGLINVYNAYQLLQSTQQYSDHNIISAEPRGSIELTQRVNFPGDQATLTIPFVVGMPGDIYFQVTGNITQIIEFNTTAINLNYPDYFEKTLNVSVPINIAPGTYTGSIEYTFNGKTYGMAIELDIKSPESKIYWDSYYTGKDDSPYYNYRTLDELLSGNLGYDTNEFNKPLSWENLSSQDILVLSDLEDALSSQELDLIMKFHKSNGSILLVTSAYPFFNPIPYAQISEILDIPVNFSDRIDVFNYTDDGRSISPSFHSPIPLSWDTDNAFLTNVDLLPMYFGTMVSGDYDDSRLDNLVIGQDYLAAFSFSPTRKGKVVFLGSELWLYPSYLQFDDGKSFSQNVFSWLKPDDRVVFDYDLKPKGLDLVIYPSNNIPTKADVYFGNGTTSVDHPILLDSTNNYLLNIGLSPSYQGELTIYLKNDTFGFCNNSIFVYKNNDVPQTESISVTYRITDDPRPSWSDDYPSVKFVDVGLSLMVEHEYSNDIKVYMIVTSQPEDTLELLSPPIPSINIRLFEFTLNNYSNPQTTKYINWDFPIDLETGFYRVEVQVWSITNITTLSSYFHFSFFKPDPEPSLSAQSTINGKTLDNYRNIETTADIDTWSSGKNIEFNLIGQDTNSNSFIVYVQLIHYYLWFADRTILDTFELPYNSESGYNTGTFVVPKSTIPIPDSEFEIDIANQIFVLLIILRDEQGNYDVEAIFCFFGDNLEFDTSTLLVGSFLGLIVLVAIIIAVKNRSKNRTTYQRRGYHYYGSKDTTEAPIQLEWKFCPFCGTRIPKLARYCSACGKEQPFI